MLTIWTLDNVRKHRSFYTEFDLLMLFASVTLWKRNQPEAHCVLYCDSMTYKVLTKVQAIHLWDESWVKYSRLRRTLRMMGIIKIYHSLIKYLND